MYLYVDTPCAPLETEWVTPTLMFLLRVLLGIREHGPWMVSLFQFRLDICCQQSINYLNRDFRVVFPKPPLQLLNTNAKLLIIFPKNFFFLFPVCRAAELLHWVWEGYLLFSEPWLIFRNCPGIMLWGGHRLGRFGSFEYSSTICPAVIWNKFLTSPHYAIGIFFSSFEMVIISISAPNMYKVSPS